MSVTPVPGVPHIEALGIHPTVETLAEMYWRATQLGAPALLSASEMEKILVRFRAYGQPK